MTLMKTLNFMKTLFLLVAIVGLSSCGDKYYSDDYLRNSNAKLCGKLGDDEFKGCHRGDAVRTGTDPK